MGHLYHGELLNNRMVYVKTPGHDYNPGLVCVLPFWTFPESYRGPGKKVEKDAPGPTQAMHTDKINQIPGYFS